MKYLPMLCQKGTKELLRSKEYIFEPKLDGTRCIAEINEEVNLFNRREKNIRKRYPFICQELKKYKGMVFDGEIVCYNKDGIPDFYLLQKREHIDNEFIIEIKAKLIPATYVIFDILEIDGKSLIDKPLEERKEILDDLFEKSEHLELIFSTPNGEALWKEIIKRNMEGRTKCITEYRLIFAKNSMVKDIEGMPSFLKNLKRKVKGKRKLRNYNKSF